MKITLVIPEKCKALQINFTYELADSIILNSKCVYGKDIKEGAVINVLKRNEMEDDDDKYQADWWE